jgi:chemotaxis protein MotB
MAPKNLATRPFRSLRRSTRAEAEEPKDKKKKKLECPACEAGAPAWMATFADMATLLMAFFVLILSFTEMEDPSITKMLEGTMTEAFGVQRNKPSLEAPIGETIIAQQYKTTKSPAGVDAKEDTTTEEPEERELEERPDVSQSENLTDIENLKRTFATEIAAGKVSLEQKDGKITVSVNEDTDSNDRDEPGTQNNDGQLDREELEIFAKGGRITSVYGDRARGRVPDFRQRRRKAQTNTQSERAG